MTHDSNGREEALDWLVRTNDPEFDRWDEFTAWLEASPANASAYHASTWGLLGLSRALHSELRSSGIRVGTIVAGGMRTPFLLERFPDLDPAKLQDPANVAEAVHFMLALTRGSVVAEIMVLPEQETSWP